MHTDVVRLVLEMIDKADHIVIEKRIPLDDRPLIRIDIAINILQRSYTRPESSTVIQILKDILGERSLVLDQKRMEKQKIEAKRLAEHEEAAKKVEDLTDKIEALLALRDEAIDFLDELEMI